MKTIEKLCPKHGQQTYKLYQVTKTGREHYRCNQCAKEAVIKNRTKYRLKALALGGSKCKICGYSKCINALQFHHLDPSKKDFNLSKEEMKRSWATIVKEIDKCVLLCSNCHVEVHAGIVKI